MQPYIDRQTAGHAKGRGTRAILMLAAILVLGLGTVLVVTFMTLNQQPGQTPQPESRLAQEPVTEPAVTSSPDPTTAPTATAVPTEPQALAELYSTSFEQGYFEWTRPTLGTEDYEAGLDNRVVHSGGASGYIKSITSAPKSGSFMPVSATGNIQDYQGKRIRYSAYVKAEQVEQWAGLWMRVDVELDPISHTTSSVDFDNMSGRPIRGTLDWKKYDIVLDVPQNAGYIYFGLLLNGKGQVWIDDVRVEEVSTDVPITGRAVRNEPCDLSFEEGPDCWYRQSNTAHLYEGGTDTSVAHSGKSSGFLKSEATDARENAGLVQMLYAEPYQGKRIRYSAYVKTEDVQDSAGLGASIVGWGNRLLVTDIMDDRPIQGTTDWQEYEVVLDVPEESHKIQIGLVLKGSGQAWIDDAQIEIVGPDVPVTSAGTPTPRP